MVVKTAIRDRIIGHDPCLDVKLPRRDRRSVSSGAFPMLTLDEFLRILGHVPDRFKVAAVLSYGSGLRWGEVAALTVRDVDGLEAGHMAVGVTRTLQEVAGRFVIKPRPKTDAGVRLVPVPDWAATVVRRHVATYCKRPGDFLVLGETGDYVSRGYARLYILRPALVRAGLMGQVSSNSGPGGRDAWTARWRDRDGVDHEETFRTEAAAVRVVARGHYTAPSSWHGLRHAYVSSLVTAGLDPVHVALAAGHSDPAFTLRTYAHPGVDALARIRQAQSPRDPGAVQKDR